jgi:hypothetical protein
MNVGHDHGSGPTFDDKLRRVFDALSGQSSAYEAFQRLSNELLNARDGNRVSIIDHLFELTDPNATPPAAGGWAGSSQDYRRRNVSLAETIIDGLDRIGQSTQGSHGTCGPECISLLLNSLEPGRWTAMVRDLFENGHHHNKLQVPRDINYNDGNSDREFRDRVLQSAIKIACPPEPGAVYSNAEDRWTSRDGRNLGNGILTRSAAETLTSLSGSHWVKTSDARIIEVIMASEPKPFYAAIRWGSDPKDVRSPHALVVTGIENGRVFFRNPWGPTGVNAVGRELTDPPRRTVDPETGVESMSVSEFMSRFHDAAVSSVVLKGAYRQRPECLEARVRELKRDARIDWDPLKGDPPSSAETYSDRLQILKSRQDGYRALAREAYKLLADGEDIEEVRHVLNYVTPSEVDTMVTGKDAAGNSMGAPFSEAWDAAHSSRGTLATLLDQWRQCTDAPRSGRKTKAEWTAERESQIVTPSGEVLSEGRFVRDTLIENPYAPTLAQRESSSWVAKIRGSVAAFSAVVSASLWAGGVAISAPLSLSVAVMISTVGNLFGSRGQTERDSLVASTSDIFNRLKARQSLTYEDCLAIVGVFKELPQLLFRGHFVRDDKGEIVPVNRYTGFFDNLADRCSRSEAPVVGGLVRLLGRAWLNRKPIPAQLDMNRDFQALLQEMNKAGKEIVRIASAHASAGGDAILDANNRTAINHTVDQALKNIEPMLSQATNPASRSNRVWGAAISGLAVTPFMWAGLSVANYFGVSAVPQLSEIVASWDIQWMKSAGEFLLRNSQAAVVGVAVLVGLASSAVGGWRELNDER